MRSHLLPGTEAKPAGAKIVAVVPASNEADLVARAVTSLLTQELDPPLDVVLVDDGSDDGTAAGWPTRSSGCSWRQPSKRT